MANNRVSNPYIELFEQLPIPERLEPRNIAAMLDAKAAQKTIIAKTSSERPEREAKAPVERKITVSSSKHRTSAAYRSVASIAACAALALGVVGYMGIGNSEIPSDMRGDGGAYASDYDDVHDTFQKFYVDDAGRTTLDSIIEDIGKSYSDTENENTHNTDPSSDPVEPDDQNQPDITQPAQPDNDPDVTDPKDDPDPVDPQPIPNETVDDVVPLPENDAVIDNSDIVFGDGYFLVRDANIIRIFTTRNGMIQYTGNIFPVFNDQASKSLVGLYAEGSKVVAVYSVVKSESFVENTESVFTGTRNSVEVCVYDIVDGIAELSSDTVQGGSLINKNFVNGSLYLVTAYSDYRISPIIDAQDLESYVPSYTVDGIKYYVEASDIMIPDYISTTDYTVISGIGVNGGVSVKAVLGYEGRVVLRNGAVYLFGYDNSYGTDLTSVRVFSLSGGNVKYAGFVDIDGVALSGDGISTFGNAIAVTSVHKVDNGYDTALRIYDETMNLVSEMDFPGALTTAKRYGSKLYLSGSKDKYRIDLSNPSEWERVSETPVKNTAEGLVEFDGGYVTLTKAANGSIVLSKITKNADGELRLEYKATVTSEMGATSKAVDNNGLLFVSANVVGLPYGYFDGVDYCYRYAFYCATDSGFVLIGYIENHETDEVYENVKAILNGGVIYIFSEGRVCSAVIGDSVAQVGAADIVESAYSGH